MHRHIKFLMHMDIYIYINKIYIYISIAKRDYNKCVFAYFTIYLLQKLIRSVECIYSFVLKVTAVRE